MAPSSHQLGGGQNSKMRQAVASGLGLAQTVVTHFGQPQSSLAVDASDSFDYEYVLDWYVGAISSSGL